MTIKAKEIFIPNNCEKCRFYYYDAAMCGRMEDNCLLYDKSYAVNSGDKPDFCKAKKVEVYEYV